MTVTSVGVIGFGVVAVLVASSESLVLDDDRQCLDGADSGQFRRPAVYRNDGGHPQASGRALLAWRSPSTVGLRYPFQQTHIATKRPRR
jgi:hypothetical protein